LNKQITLDIKLMDQWI